MIRYKLVESKVYNIYSALNPLKYPIQPEEIIKLMPTVRYMTYQEFAELNKLRINTVCHLCESNYGCTQYDILNNRYLILCNDVFYWDNSLGRQRWTKAHELGHIVCKHFQMTALSTFSENPQSKINNEELEHEADFFASTLLAPLPMFQLLDIQNPHQARWKFGLSKTAAENRFHAYERWKQRGYMFSWEKEIVRLYQNKHN